MEITQSEGEFTAATPRHLHPWQIEMKLSAEELRLGSPVAQLIDMLGTAPEVERHKDYLHTIITELFSNALEHGVLELSSQIKKTEDGYLDYYQQREERLRQLASGHVNITLSFHHDSNRGYLQIQVDDSGRGFDFTAHRQTNDDDSFGRGLSLLETLCESIEYSNHGSRVNVRYLID